MEPVVIARSRVRRRTFLIENHANFSWPISGFGGGTDNEDDRVTKWVYDGLDNVTSITAYNGGIGSTQVTETKYASTVDASWPTLVKYPDGSTGGSDNVQYTYHTDGTLDTRTDQRGTVLTFSYDPLRRPESQTVTTSGGADTYVDEIKRSYDPLGRLEFVTSYGTEGMSHPVRNEVKFTFDDLHRVTQSEQAHDGAVTGGTPAVQYAYDLSTDGSNIYSDNARLEGITYPDGRVIAYTFGPADEIDDRTSRVQQIHKSLTTGTVLVDYQYLAGGALAQSDYGVTGGQPDLRNSFHAVDSDDEYEAYDRFGRVKYAEWRRYSGTPTTLDRYDYTYDFVGNRTSRDIDHSVVASAPSDHDHAYTFDELHRLKTFDEGQLSGGSITNKQFGQAWVLQQLDNWLEFREDADGNGTPDLDQDRLHNSANEIDNDNTHSNAPSNTITASTGTNWADPVQDAAGNMTEVPQPGDLANSYDLTYDAWNRLVEVDDGATDVVQYEYDGLGRRIEKRLGDDDTPTATYDYYYSTAWQVLEVHKDGDDEFPYEQYVWHAYYLDAPAVRFYDADTDGNFVENNDGEHYYGHDAQFNVTAVYDVSGSVIERYDYRPYGGLVVMNSSFTDIGSSPIGNPYTFTGREFDDETGLFHFRRRYYHAELGRFVGRDAIGYADGFNLYASYWAVNGVEPFGLERDWLDAYVDAVSGFMSGASFGLVDGYGAPDKLGTVYQDTEVRGEGATIAAAGTLEAAAASPSRPRLALRASEPTLGAQLPSMVWT